MRRAILFSVAVAGLVGGFVAWWRRHPRFGATWVTRVADPWLVRQGVVASSKGEIGLLEHVGRKTGTVRVTPVHPVRTPEGFRIVVPLGIESHWAQNVVAAGHCRLQIENTIHELDEPLLVMASVVEELPEPATRAMDWLGFRYLVLRQFAEHEGSLETPTVETAEEQTEPAPEEAAPVV